MEFNIGIRKVYEMKRINESNVTITNKGKLVFCVLSFWLHLIDWFDGDKSR